MYDMFGNSWLIFSLDTDSKFKMTSSAKMIWPHGLVSGLIGFSLATDLSDC